MFSQVTGLAFLGIGLLIFANVIPVFPASITDTTALSNVGASCDPSNSCTGYATIFNNNASGIPFLIWFSIYNQNGQSVEVVTQQTTISPGASQQVTKSLGTLASGMYTLTVFVTNLYYTSLSKQSSTTFGTGTTKLTLRESGAGTGTVTPTPGTYSYAYGTQVTLSFAPSSTTTFQCWFVVNLVTSSTSCPTTNPYTLTMDSDYEVVSTTSLSPAALYFTVLPQGSDFGGVINPSGPQKIYPTSAGANLPSTITFTTVPKAGYYVKDTATWKVDGVAVGQGKSVTITYDQLKPIAQQYGGNNMYLNVEWTQRIMLTINPSTGLTLTPSPGSYYYELNTNVVITETPQSGYCFQQWYVDAKPSGNASSITITMDQAHGVYGQTIRCPTLTVNHDNGVTTNPEKGQYTQATAGGTVTVSVTVTQGYCFTGWNVDSVSKGKDSSVTVTMDKDHTVYATAQPLGFCSVTTTTSTTTGGGGGKGNYGNQLLGGALMGFGVFFLLVKRKK